MCLGSSEAPKAVAAEAPPAPEPTPEEVIAPEETTAKAQEKKQTKIKASGLDAYRTDNGSSGLNVPV